MKYMPGFTDFFMSPVTGRIILPMFPDLTDDYIWIGGFDDRPIESPALIDLRLEIVDLRNRLASTDFIIGYPPAEHFDNAQILSNLENGILQHTHGVISIATIIPIDLLPDLPYHNIWIGDETNRPVAQGRIWDDGVGDGNLPAYTSTEANKIWRMNADGVPVLTDALTSAETSITDILSQISDIISNIASIVSDIAGIVGDIATITDNISSIFSDIATITGNISSIFSSIATITDNIATIFDSIASILTTITGINDAIAVINADIVVINDAIAVINAQIISINDAIVVINAQIVSINDAIGVINVTLGDLQTQIDTNISSGLDHLADLQAQIDAGISSGMDHLATINSEISSINDQITTINTEISDITTTLGDGSITLTGNVTGSGTTGTPFATTLTLTLDEIPLAAADVNINTHKLTNVVDPTSAQDAATKHYVDNSTITLTGDVTGSGDVNSSFATTLTLHLNQIPLATGNLNLNSHQINNLIMAGSPAGTDAVNVSYLNSQIGGGTVILTGAVTGSGHVNDGGFATTLASTVNMASGGETFSFGSSVTSAAFTLLSNYVPTSLTPGNIELTLQNQRGSGFQLLLDSSYSGGLYPDGRFEFYAFTSSTSTQIYQCTSDLFTFQIPVTMTTDMSMAANKITNVLDPSSAQDAATKNYVDTRTVTLIGEVTGSGDLGTNINTTVVGPIELPFEFYTPNPTSDFTLINEFVPIAGTDSQVELRMWNNSFYGMVFQLNTTYSGGVYPEGVFQAFYKSSTTTLKAYEIFPTYVQFVMPVTMLSALDMSTNLIHNVVDPVSAQDAATKNYVDTTIGGGTVTLLGAVTGSGFVNDGGFTTTLASTVNMTSGGETFSFGSSVSSASFTLLANYVPTSLTPGNIELTLQNQRGSGFHLLLDSSSSGGTYPDGRFEFYAFTSSTSTQIYKCDSTLFTFNIPVTINNTLSMASNNITNVLDPVSYQDAATKYYVDSRTVTLTGDVTGINYVGLSIATTLSDLINKTNNDQIFSYAASNRQTGFTLVNNYIPNGSNASYNELVFQNNSSKFYTLYHYTDTSNTQGLFVLTDGTTTHFQVSSTSFSLGVPLDVQLHKIINLATPTSSTDAATKAYCDALPSVSGAFSIGGALNMNSHLINNVTDPSSAQDAATKHYVDTKTLDTFTAPAANLSLNSHKIINLATPTLSTDATTKAYVDALASVSGAFSIGGALNMNSHLINNVTDPSSAQDAATKNYIDSRKACGTLISNPGTTTSMSAGLNTVLNGMTVAGNCSNFTAASGKLTYTGTPTVNVLVVVDLSYAFSVNSSVSIELYKNTSFLGFGGGTFVASGNSVSSSMSYVLSMSTNDYITLEMYSTQTGTLTLNQSYLSAIAC